MGTFLKINHQNGAFHRDFCFGGVDSAERRLLPGEKHEKLNPPYIFIPIEFDWVGGAREVRKGHFQNPFLSKIEQKNAKHFSHLYYKATLIPGNPNDFSTFSNFGGSASWGFPAGLRRKEGHHEEA